MPVYVFFDESGDLNFSPKGSRFFFFGALTTRDPVGIANRLNTIRYDLITRGVELERFHASEDSQHVRDVVFPAIASLSGASFDAVVVEKRKVVPELHDQARFYPQFADHLLQRVFGRMEGEDRVVVITDTIPVKKKRKAVEKAFKQYIRKNLGDRPFSILHHSSYSHPPLQAADYILWAIHKKWSHGDSRSYRLVDDLIVREYDILSQATRYFW